MLEYCLCDVHDLSKMFFQFPHLFERGENSLVESPVNSVDFTTTSCAIIIEICLPFQIIIIIIIDVLV